MLSEKVSSKTINPPVLIQGGTTLTALVIISMSYSYIYIIYIYMFMYI